MFDDRPISATKNNGQRSWELGGAPRRRRSIDVVALGELSVALISTARDVSLVESPAFLKTVGGASAHVAVALAQLGVASGFVGKVGNDDFGHALAQALSQSSVDTSALHFCDKARTMLSFRSLREDGEREWMFYRHPSADMLLRPEEIDHQYIGAARILHYDAVSFAGEPSRSAALAAIVGARKNGLLLSFAPNTLLPMWPSTQAARQGILEGWQFAQIICVGREELTFLSGETDVTAATQQLWHDRLRLLVITDDRKGCRYFVTGAPGRVPIDEAVSVDTAGGREGFVAALLSGLLDKGLAWNSVADLGDILHAANSIGALARTQRGAAAASSTSDGASQLLEMTNFGMLCPSLTRRHLQSNLAGGSHGT